MKDVVRIKEEDIEHYTESSVMLNEIYSLDDDTKKVNHILTLDVDNVCLNFTNKAMDIFKKLAEYRKFFNVRFIQSKDSSYYLVNIKNTIKDLDLFKSCAVLGINVTELRLGVGMSEGTVTKLYLSNKILKTVTRLGEDTKTQLVMYFVSLAYFCIAIAGQPSLFLGYETFSNRLTLNASVFENLKHYLYNFKSVVIELEAFPTSEFTSVTYFSTPYTKVDFTVSQLTNYDYALCYKEGTTEPFLLLNTKATAGLIGNTLRVYEHAVITNWELTLLDMEDDSIYTYLASKAIRNNFTIVSSPSLKFKEGDSFRAVDDYDSIPDGLLKDVIIDCDKCRVDTISSFKKFETDYKIKFLSEGTFNVEDIRESYKDDEYAQILYANKEDYYDDFNLKKLGCLIKSILKGDTYSLLFTGDAGSGKSTAAAVIVDRCGLPYVSVNFSTNIEEADFIGSFIPNPNKKSELDPPFIWNDGLLTRCVRNGYPIGLEEINMARGGILSKLNSLLDDHRQIELPTGEIVKAHKNFRLFATGNIGAAYEGTNRLNKALINRFDIVQEFEEPSRSEMIDIIMSRLKYTDKAKIEKILNVYYAIKKYSKEQNLDLIISLRQLLKLFRQGKYFKNAEDAVDVILLNSAFLQDRDYYLDFKDTVLTAFDLAFKI